MYYHFSSYDIQIFSLLIQEKFNNNTIVFETFPAPVRGAAKSLIVMRLLLNNYFLIKLCEIQSTVV